MANYLSTPINTKLDLVYFGIWAQSQGFYVWEHTQFYKFKYSKKSGTYSVGAGYHNSRSFHKYDMALDINYPGGGATEAYKIKTIIIPMAQKLGFSYIYAQYGTFGSAAAHTKHIHVDCGSSTNNGARYIRTAKKAVNVASVLKGVANSVSPQKKASNRMSNPEKSSKLTYEIQRILRLYNRKIVLDGKYGPETEKYVKVLQRNLHVTQDGQWGPKTARAYLARQPVMKVGVKTSNKVRIVQYMVGATVDGKYGQNTKSAVQACQRYYGLKADGVFGAKSRAVLVR